MVQSGPLSHTLEQRLCGAMQRALTQGPIGTGSRPKILFYSGLVFWLYRKTRKAVLI